MEPDLQRGLGIRLLVLQPTPFCNIDCTYCYLFDRNSTATMSLATLDRACSLVFESPLLRERLGVAWHGGEPLAVPLKWYEFAIEIIELRRPADLELQYRFQTNGILVDENWARFFSQTNARVGLSIDGPAKLHDAQRRTRGGQGTHHRAMRAVRILKDWNIPFHVITVLTESSLEAPEEPFNFYVQNGITDVGFNIEEIEGANYNSTLSANGVEAKVRAFIKSFFDLVWQSPGLLKVVNWSACSRLCLLMNLSRMNKTFRSQLLAWRSTERFQRFHRNF